MTVTIPLYYSKNKKITVSRFFPLFCNVGRKKKYIEIAKQKKKLIIHDQKREKM